MLTGGIVILLIAFLFDWRYKKDLERRKEEQDENID